MRKIYLGLIACLISIASNAITATQYSCTYTAGNVYTSISGTGTLVTSGILVDDGTVTAIPIGFTFTFCGTGYTTLSACSNGWLSLANSTATTYTPAIASITGAGMLMPLWRDLYGATGENVYYRTTGTAPNRVFTIEFYNWSMCCATGNNENFQVKLYEGVNVIQYIYGSYGTAATGAAIGIANSTADYELLTSITSATYSTTSFTGQSEPLSGVMFQFTPPVTPSSCVPTSATACTSFSMYTAITALTGTLGTSIADVSTCAPQTSQNYYDETAITSVVLAQGVTYSATLAGGPTYYATTNAQVWIDFNNNGIFETTESVGGIGSSTTYFTAATQATNLVIPATATIGTHRMRIVSNYECCGASFYPSINPCPTAVITYADVKDYKVSIAPAPIGGSSAECAGSALLTLTETTAGGTWSSSNTSIATIAAGVVTGVAAGTVNITYTVGLLYAIKPITIYALPTITATATPIPVCTNATLTLNSTPTGGSGTYTTFAWTGPSGFTAAVQNTTRASMIGTYAGVYSVTVTDNNGCKSAVAGTTASVTVATLPTITASALPNPVCTNSTLNLSSTASGGSGTYSNYFWSGPSAFTATTTTNTTTRASMIAGYAGVYSVTVRDNNGCNSTLPGTTASIVVVAAPTITATVTPTLVCTNGTITLNATPAGGSGTYTSFSWTGPTSFIASTQNTTRAGMLNTYAGMYSVTVTDNNNCTSLQGITASVTVAALPTITASATPIPVCTNSTLTLNATPTGGSGTYTTFAWTGPSGFTAAVQNTTRASMIGTYAGVYSVTVTDNNGCKSAVAGTTASVTVATLPTITASALPNPVCTNSTLNLSSTASGGSGTYTNYFWSGPSSFTSSTTTNTTTRTSIIAGYAGVYSVTVRDNNGCNSTLPGTTASVAVAALPTITSTVTPTLICTNGTITLNATPAGGSGTYTSFSWTGPTSFIASTQNTTRAGMLSTYAGIYSVTVTDNNNCTSLQGITASVTVAALPTITASATPNPVCTNSTLTLNATPSGGSGTYTTISWTGPSGFTATVQNTTRASMIGTYAGVYSVSVTDNNGCTSAVPGTTASVTVATLPTITASALPNPVCTNSTLNLSSTASGGSGTYTNYFWSGPSSFTASTTTNTTTRASMVAGYAGVYSVTVRDNNGCNSTLPGTTASVAVAPLPTITAIATPNPVCQTATLSINSTPSGGSGTYTNYYWAGPSSFTATTTTSSTTRTGITTAMAGIYSVSVIDNNNCISAIAGTTASVTVSQAPTTLASGILISGVTTSGVTLNWTSGGGMGRIVVISPAGSAIAPVAGTSYVANTIYGSGGTTGAGNFVVYNASGTTVSITGLAYSTAYVANVYEFNSTTGCIYYSAPTSSSIFTTLCGGTPTAGTASISPTYGNSSTTFTLSLLGYTVAPGITFQWQSSPNGTTWSNIGGATTINYSFSSLSATTYYQCTVGCTGYGSGVASNTVMANFITCLPTVGSWASVGNITYGFNGTNNTTSPGSVQTFVVPTGVTTVGVDMAGAVGGYYIGIAGAVGGYGGRTQGTVAVTPGQSLYIYVGHRGDSAQSGMTAIPSGGSNSGGGANGGAGSTSNGGSTGGGATDIRTIAGNTFAALNSRLMVAAGGGGGSYNSGEAGGVGGGLTGGGGYSGGTTAWSPGNGGTPTSGGIAEGTGAAGGFGYGGAADPTYWGSGGGGGWYGGGGCYVGSGGGGSSYYSGTGVTGGSTTPGYQNGDGYVIISYSGGNNTAYGVNSLTINAAVGSNLYDGGITGVANATTGYLSRMGTISPITLYAGGVHSGTLTFGTPATYEEAQIWIDFNNDGTFASSEEVTGVIGYSATSAPSTVPFNISIPSWAALGTHMMRVRGVLELPTGTLALSSHLDPCLNQYLTTGPTYDFGDVVDYYVTITTMPGCVGTPSPGTAIVAPSTGNSSTSFTLTTTGFTLGTGITFQWQNSTDGSTWASIPGATNFNYSFTGIMTNMYYSCIVSCGTYSATTNTTLATFVLPASSCTPAFTAACSAYPMTMSLASLTGVMGTSITDVTACGGGYEDYSSTLSCTLYKGNTYTANLQPSTTYYGSFGAEMWIDFNSDGIFQPTEVITGTGVQVAGFTSASPLGVPITIPNTVSNGIYRMRLVGTYNYTGYVAPPNMNPCPTAATVYYGDVRDYKVTILTPPPTASVTPVSLNFGNVAINTNSASMTSVLNANWMLPAIGNLTVTATSNYKVSPNGTTWYSVYTIPYTGGTLASNTVYVQFNAPASVGTYTGNVSISGGGITTLNIALTGNAAINCAGTPIAGTATVSPLAGTSSTSFTLSLSGTSIGLGLSYQWQSSATGTSGWGNISGATNASYTFTETNSTYYQCLVTCSFTTYTGTSNVVYVPVYCVPTSASWSSESGSITYGADQFRINGLGSSTLNDVGIVAATTSANPTTGYLDRTGLTPVLMLPGGVYASSVTFGSSSSHQFTQIWIDFNDDGTFASSEEVTPVSGYPVTQPTVANITIPTWAPIGTHKLRMRAIWENNSTDIGAAPAHVDPCLLSYSGANPQYWSGTITDYSVTIVPPPTCAATPPSLTFPTTSVGLTSAIQTFALSATHLLSAPGNLTVTAPTGYNVSLNGTTWASSVNVNYASATLGATTIYVDFSPIAASIYSGNISVSGGGMVVPFTIPITGTGSYPVITPTPSSLAFGTTLTGAYSTIQNISINGSYLNPLGGTISVNYPANFYSNTSGGTTYSVPYTGGVISAVAIPVYFKPTANITYTGNVAFSGGGLIATVNVPVTGTGGNPCLGTPIAGTATVTPTYGNGSTAFTLGLTGYTLAAGLTFQWQYSPDGTAWTNITGATNINYGFVGLLATTYFHCIVTCTGLGSPATSSTTSATLMTCLPTSGSWASVGNITYGFTGTNNTTSPGSVQTFVVPTGVTTIGVDMAGAVGGYYIGVAAAVGGYGGRTQGTVAVTPGQSLYIYVGHRGDSAQSGMTAIPSGGSNSGGGANGGAGSTSVGGSTGGGATDIRTILGNTFAALNSRLMVAAGGGGGSYNSGEAGGVGGGLTGGGGYSGGTTPWSPGNGGTPTSGGIAEGTGVAGGFGYGGAADPTYWGSGGGGGWYGGGGCYVGSGGGGSSYYGGTGVTGGSTTPGYQNGDGYVIISYSGGNNTAYGINTLTINAAVGSNLYDGGITGVANATTGYLSRMGTISPITLYAGGVHSGTLTFGTPATYEEAQIWIDFNNDGTFATSEEVTGVIGYSATSAPSTVPFNITIPPGAALGTHMMRVRGLLELPTGTLALSSHLDPCLNQYLSTGPKYDFGDVVDYYVTIGSMPACTGAITGVTTNASTGYGCSPYFSTLTLTGVPIASGITYQWQSSSNGSTWADVSGAVTNSYAASVATNVYYRCNITCSAGGGANPSSSAYLIMGSPGPINFSLSGSIPGGPFASCNTTVGAYFTGIVTGGVWTSSATTYGSVNPSTGVWIPTSSVGSETITYSIGPCTATATIYNNVSVPSTPTLSSGVNPMCVYSSLTLTSTPTSGVWRSGNTTFATVGAITGSVYGVANGNVTISYNTGCGFVTYPVTINGTAITFSPPSGSVLCAGSNVSLTATYATGTGSSYSWSGPGVSSSTPTLNLLAVTPAANGYYTFNTTTTTGCTETLTTFLSVDAANIPTITATAVPANICPSGSSTLSNSTATQNPQAYTLSMIPYGLTTFTSMGTLIGDDVASGAITLPFTFNYFGTNYSSLWVATDGWVSFTSSAGSPYSNYTIPSASMASQIGAGIAFGVHDLLASGTMITYGSTGIAPNRSFVIWFNNLADYSGGGSVSGQVILHENTNAIDVMLTSITYGSYYNSFGIQSLTGTLGMACPGWSNTSSSLPSTASQGWRFSVPTYNYTWSPSSSLSSTTGTVVSSAGLLATQTYSVTTTDQYGCTVGNSATAAVNVYDVPIVSGANASPTPLCAGGTVSLGVTATAGIDGISSYNWSGPSGYTYTSSTTGYTSFTSTTASSGIYTFTATSIHSCSVTATTGSISVYAQPTISMTASTSSLCSGSAETLNAVPTGGIGTAIYTWSGPGIVSTTSSTPTPLAFTPTISGSSPISGLYSVTVTYSGFGCNSVSATTPTSVTVNPVPSAGAISGTAYVCGLGNTTNLTIIGTITGSGAWSSSAISVATVNPISGIVTGISAGTATITFTATTASCGSAFTTLPITVYPTPNAGSIIGTPTVCLGSTLTITSTGALAGGTWSSGNTTVATIGSSTGVVNGILNGTSAITYTSSNICGSSTATNTVTVLPIPDAGSITGIGSVCMGSTTTFSSSGIAGGTWTSGNTSIATVGISSGVITPVSNGTSLITYTSTNMCGTSTATNAVTVNLLPNAGTLSGTLFVCAGNNTSLSDAGSVGTSTWNSGSTSVATINSSGMVTGISAGTAIMTYSVSTVCGSASTTATVTVNASPNAGTISGVGNVCGLGSTVSLSITGTVIGTIVWSSSASSIASVNPISGAVTGISAGNATITFTATTPSCGDAYTTLPISVYPTPNAGTITGTPTVCLGNTITISSTGALAGGTWTSSTTTVATIGSTDGIVNSISSGTSAITYTSTNACGTSIATNTVSVLPIPDAGIITGINFLCAGGTTIFTSSGISSGSWTSGNTTVANVNISSGLITGVASGTAIITYSSANFCGSSNATKTVTIDPVPDLTTILVSPTSLCVGVPVSMALTGGLIEPSTGTMQYIWSGPGGIYTSTITGAYTTQTFTASTTAYSGVYTLDATYSEPGCNSSITVPITVSSLPTATVTASVSPLICDGTTQTISVNPTGGAGSPTFTWSGPGISTPTLGTTTFTVVPTSSGAYTVVVAYPVIGCGSATAYTDPVTYAPTTWQGTTSTDWYDGTNWNCGNRPTATGNVLVPSGTVRSAIVGASGGDTRLLTINSGATVSIISGATLNVYGDLVNNGEVTDDGNLYLTGSVAQTIYGVGHVNNIEMHNSSLGGIAINSVTPTSDSVIARGSVKLSLGNFNTNGLLVLDASDTSDQLNGRIDPITSGATISGKVIMQQYIRAGQRAYRFWGTPFNESIPLSQLETYMDITGSGGSSHGFTITVSNAASAFWYNPLVANNAARPDPGWQAFTWCNDVWTGGVHTSGDNNLLHQYEGIRLFFRGSKGEGLDLPIGMWYQIDACTVRDYGHVNTGHIDMPLQMVSGVTTSHVNQKSNPYPCPVDIGTIVFNAYHNGMLWNPYVYVWDPFLIGAGNFINIDESGTTAVPFIIPANTSFQVNTAYNGATLSFDETNKAIIPTAPLLKANQNSIILNVYDESYRKCDIFRMKFMDEATDEIDRAWDAEKHAGMDFNFYSWSSDHVALTVDKRPFTAGKVVPLGITSNILQTFIIRADEFTVPVGSQLYLYDKLLDKYVLLGQGVEYKFKITKDPATQGDNRFELGMVAAEAPMVKTTNSLKVLMIPNPASSGVNITFNAPASEQTSIRILSVEGICVMTQDFGIQQSGSFTLPLTNLASGVYMVEFTSGTFKVIQRLVKE